MFLICFFCKFSALVSIDNQYFTRNQQIMKKKIGMEAVYVDGDLRFGSGITEYYPNGDPTGVDMTEATVKQIKSVDFYDLSGRKLSALQRASAYAPSHTPTDRRRRERL